MAFRPISFSIPSTTELKVKFSDSVSEELTSDNFKVVSLSGNSNDLLVTGVEISENQIIIKTRPQIGGNFYLLHLLDSEEKQFSSEKGKRLIDDDVSRALFFVGIDKPNSIRDAMFKSVPSIFSLENSKIGSIYSAQAEEALRAVHSIGELLSDNYISINVFNEIRTRGPSAHDRLSNEGAYDIARVSKTMAGSIPLSDTIEFSEANSYLRMDKVPSCPVSLQQVVVEEEVISSSTEGNSFNGYLISLFNKNVIKLLSIKLIEKGEEEDCYGNIGTDYNVEQYKYGINTSYYDPQYGFPRFDLDSNQVLLSEFSGFPRPKVGDVIIATYVYKDTSRFILEDDSTVYSIDEVINEPVPSNLSSFFLGNAPIVDSSHIVYEKGGVSFKISENDDTTPDMFSRELVFNFSKLPRNIGEFSVNYETGEVFVVGDVPGEGTGRNNFYVDYNFKNEYENDLDFVIYNNDFAANTSRGLVGSECFISVKYDEMFIEGDHYLSSSHIEVMNEYVESNLSSSFSVKPLNTPVTNVFRIVNQTSGEIYNPLYYTDNEIFFSGNESPRVNTIYNEFADFEKISNEELVVSGEFICPAFEVMVTSRDSSNSLFFHPPIPAELISLNSEDYFIREVVSGGNDDILVDDIQIRFWGDADSENLINSVGIKAGVSLPPVRSKIYIGTRAYIFNLQNEGILNKNIDSIGSFLNSSITLSSDLFVNEKFYEPLELSIDTSQTTSGGLSMAISNKNDDLALQNLSRVRKVGDYSVDYKNGVIYLAVGRDEGYSAGEINYFSSNCIAKNRNIYQVTSASKKSLSSDPSDNALISYDRLSNTNSSIKVLDLENSLHTFENEVYASDLNGILQETLVVLDDYTFVTKYPIKNIHGFWSIEDIYGKDLNSAIFESRVEDRTGQEIHDDIISGGYNLYVNNSVSFEENVVDLKKYVKRRIYLNESTNLLELSILDENIKEFRRAKTARNGEEIFDAGLNYTKVRGVSILGVNSYDDNSASISIYSADLAYSRIDSDGDYIVDSSGNRFEIIDYDDLRSNITVSLPADNNLNSGLPSVDSGADSLIVIKPTVDILDDGMFITIPRDSGIMNGEIIEVEYLPSWVPDIGSALAIDYRYGGVYLDYYHVYDDIVIYYEYGDNSLDWSISNALSEGEGYFVTYKFGALRDSLRKNFGTLTDIEFFNNFSLNTNRELYRDGVNGVLQAFPKGPIISAFEELISSFTKMTPNIKEMIFYKWILGRDYLSPDDIVYDGNLVFSGGRFDDGLIIDDSMVVHMPAISNLKLEEGTVSAWIRPDWAGISNDADLTFYIKNIGTKNYKYIRGTDIFSIDNGFFIENTELVVGGSGSSVDGLSLHNYDIIYGDSGEEEVLLGEFFLSKKEDGFSEITPCKVNIDIKIEKTILNDGLSYDSSSGVISKPAFFALNNNDRVIMLTLEVRLASFGNSNDLFYIEISEDDIEYTELPNYNNLHVTRSFDGNIGYELEPLLKFRSDNYMKINFGTFINIDSLINNNLSLSKDVDDLVFIVDSNGAMFKIVEFLDNDGLELDEDSLDAVYGVYVERLPINMPEIVSLGPEEINNYIPVGRVALCYQSVRVNANDKALNDVIGNLEYIIDWTNNHINLSIDSNPIENFVNIKIEDKDSSNIETVSFNYTDFPSEVDDFVSDSNILFGTFDKKSRNEINIFNINYEFDYRYSLSDIHIGKDSFNPATNPFTINKNDYPLSPIGMPSEMHNGEGIFIWFDELCENPLGEGVGQWIFRTRINKIISKPVDVGMSDDHIYYNIYDNISINEKIEGVVTTNGEFSSVVRSSRDEDENGCCIGTICKAKYRYCAGGTLDEVGWVRLEDSDSSIINVIFDGRETTHSKWLKSSDFDSSYSNGIYRIEAPTSDGGFVYTPIPCYGGDEEFIVSAKVILSNDNVDNVDNFDFSGAISGLFSGISPLHINDGIVNYKISLATGPRGEGLVLVVDGEENSIEDIILFNWNDGGFHEYKFVKIKNSGHIDLYIDGGLYSKVSLDDFSDVDIDSCTIFSEPHLAIYVSDEFIANNNFSNNILDIDFIFYNGVNIEDNITLENDDIFISTDSKVEFLFTSEKYAFESADGYDGYDAYDAYDGYLYDISEYDVDEICMSSDRLRYIVDSGVEDSRGRISIFKDGKGFLNFRIFDDYVKNKNEVGFYNLATNIKYFKPGELHHVSASWRLNSLEEKDEMHLFVDGLEAPNIFKFGGAVPVRINDKFSDVSKEVLQSFLVDDIEYYDSYFDGIVAATNSVLMSDSANFDESFIGRSIIIEDSSMAPTLVGGEYIITSVSGNQVTLADGLSLAPIIFDVSASDIKFTFPPTAGLKNNILSDLRNGKVALFKTNCNFESIEIGGIFYEIVGNEVSILSGDNIINPQFRANVESRVIEFVGKDNNCKFNKTVDYTDLDVHIESFGLTARRVNSTIDLSSSSYNAQTRPDTGQTLFQGVSRGSGSGESYIMTTGPEPIAIEDVKIRRILLERTIIEIDIDESLGGPLSRPESSSFSIDLSSDDARHYLITEQLNLTKTNMGRYISVVFDSDNVRYCDTYIMESETTPCHDAYDAYDAYDSYCSEEENIEYIPQNTITVHGRTVDGVDSETFIIDKNGVFAGKKLFTSIDRVEGSMLFYDENYFELGVLSIIESDLITKQNNNGSYAEIDGFYNGTFVITEVGSSGLFPFELPPGKYHLDYPAYLKVFLPMIGERIFIGSDIHGENQLGGVIDEFRIISEMSSDTRPVESETSGTRSVTKDFNRAIPFCLDEQTLSLIHFDNPIEWQSRRLRVKEFLDEENNFKYKIPYEQREVLVNYVNNREMFVSKMMYFGFDEDEALKTFYEVHMAEGGPLINNATYLDQYSDVPLSTNSVNDSFGKSGVFDNGNALLYENNNGIFRRDEGTIEFWTSPLLDVKNDIEDRYYVDIYAIERKRVLSSSTVKIELPDSASKIVSVKMLRNTVEFSDLFSKSEVDNILFDDLHMDKVTGRLSGGTGVDKDFSQGSTLSPDGKTVTLLEPLPSFNTDVVVTYVPNGSSGDRISIYKNEDNEVVFRIIADGIEHIVNQTIDWRRNSWHRVSCFYKANSESDTMSIIIDNEEGGILRFGEGGLSFGDGFTFGQVAARDGNVVKQDFNINLSDSFRLISIGASVFGDRSGKCRMDNIRFSREIRKPYRNSAGLPVDPNYSSNLNSAWPIVSDDATTMLINFDEFKDISNNFARLMDPKYGIFDFDIEVIDDLGKVIGVNDGEIEDLIIELANRLKPAHSNALVKFFNKHC